VLRKLDSLGGAVVAAVGGAGASQWREFLQQYLQRLGGHLDEARLNLEHLTGLHDLADVAQKPVIARMLADGEARVGDLVQALRMLAEAGPVMQPLVFLRTMDPVIARAALERYQPALPLDTASLLWAGAGMVLALILYELVKGALWAPIALGRRALGGHPPGGRRTATSRRVAPADRVEPRL